MWMLVMIAWSMMQAVAPAPAAAPDSGEEAAVRAVVARYLSARDARDQAALAEIFTPDADQYTTTGDWRRGRERLLPGMAESSRQNPGARGIRVQAVRFVTPDVAIADGAYAIAGSDLPRWTTLVLVRDAGSWRITAIRNMTPVRASSPPR
jgi:uncharacterized protein (TIGR02246 family)